MTDELDISDVSLLRTRDGRKVLQAHRGKTRISFETEEGDWFIVGHDGRSVEHTFHMDELIHIETAPWENAPTVVTVHAGSMGSFQLVPHQFFRFNERLIDTREYRLVPIDQEPQR